MNIYKIEQNINKGYDTYDSLIVIAENEKEAKDFHPNEFVTHIKGDKWMGTYKGSSEEYETENIGYSCWVTRNELDKLKMTLIGKANENQKKGIILASFNPG